jgi:hypothetical protein
MFFATVQDTNISDNTPFAAAGATEEEVSQKVCKYLQDCYEMPKEINTLDAARNWFSGNVEDGEEKREDAASYDTVWVWNTEEM